MCRGDGWQTEPWPLIRGKKTLEECSEVCKNRKGCTAFEMGPPEKKGRFKCVLYVRAHHMFSRILNFLFAINFSLKFFGRNTKCDRD